MPDPQYRSPSQKARPVAQPADAYRHRRRLPPSTDATTHVGLARGVLVHMPSAENSPTCNPRRTSARNGIAGKRGEHKPAKARRMSSDDSNATDPAKWFDQSNENPGQSFGPRDTDVDTPYFQKESDSSNVEISKDFLSNYPYLSHVDTPTAFQPVVASSSAEDYRSVIDDLTIEIQRLKEELRQHKQRMPNKLKKDAIFEVKVHRLTKEKKRELERRLREFAASMSPSSRGDDLSPRDREEKNRRSLASKGTSSTGPGKPVDSAYASMSATGGHSNSSLLLAGRPSLSGRARSAQQKVQSYLEGVPEGLHPRYVVLPEKDKQKLVVKRLEKLFTGTIGRHHRQGISGDLFDGHPPLIGEASAMSANSMPDANIALSRGPGVISREARMLTTEGGNYKMSRDTLGSTSMSTGDHTEFGGTGSGNASGSGTGTGDGNSGGNGNPGGKSSRRKAAQSSPVNAQSDEQRPTRVHDLDPDRNLPPSENMEYIRHLGLAPPNNPSETIFSSMDMAADADGWVWLNLLCNMAQLHMLNVTPSFIRKAVAKRSTKFQISDDGQKIRWRGGNEGTRFSSDSSGHNSRRGGATDEETPPEGGSGGQRKKLKTEHTIGSTAACSGTGSFNSYKNARTNSLVANSSSDAFHYKPMFVQQISPSLHPTSEDTASVGLGSNVNSISQRESNLPGEASSSLQNPRSEGSIVFYSGAPFCTDLSRDLPANPSPPLPSEEHCHVSLRPDARRTISGSPLAFRPLSQHPLPDAPDLMHVDSTEEEFIGADSAYSGISGGEDETDDELFPWGDTSTTTLRKPRIESLDASGLGGVAPDDHFLVHVVTRRPKLRKCASRAAGAHHADKYPVPRHDDTTELLISRIADMTTSSVPPSTRTSRNLAHPVKITHLTTELGKLEPSPLPPPATYLPPFSSDEEDDDSMDLDDSSKDEDESSELVEIADANDREGLLSRLENPQFSRDTSGDSELSSCDEEDEVDPEYEAGYDASNSSEPNVTQRRSDSRRDTSSAATAGDGLDRHPSPDDSSEDDGDAMMS